MSASRSEVAPLLALALAACDASPRTEDARPALDRVLTLPAGARGARRVAGGAGSRLSAPGPTDVATVRAVVDGDFAIECGKATARSAVLLPEAEARALLPPPAAARGGSVAIEGPALSLAPKVPDVVAVTAVCAPPGLVVSYSVCNDASCRRPSDAGP